MLLTGVQHKVRDVKYNRDVHKLASLGADGTLKLWDPNLNIISSVNLDVILPLQQMSAGQRSSSQGCFL